MIYVEDNITRYLLIMDACYRAHALAWDTSPVDLGLRNYGNESITMTRYSGNGSDSATKRMLIQPDIIPMF